MENNPYENNINNTPDYTPDEYYQKNFSNTENSAENYAKYGEDFYAGNKTTENHTTVNNTSSNSSYNTTSSTQNNNVYSSYGSTQNTNYGSAYNNTQYQNSPYSYAQTATAPKRKKEKKPVTRGALAFVLIISILCSGLVGVVGGYLAGVKGNNGLTINKSDSSGTSYHASNSTLSTSEIVDKAADTVVEITTEAVVTSSFAQQYIQEGAGSGVIISSDGYIVTNYHVIEGASQITVTLRDHTEYKEAEVIGTYAAGDLALIKISPDKDLPATVFGDSDKLSVGDYAVAIGNPLGQLGGTVTDGIISALDREVTIDDETMNLLQTNAEISPGNSGGGLFNGKGELIGIVNAKSSTEAAEGLGFAIPVNDVQDVLSDLKEYGYVKGQIDLGMSLSDINSTAQAWMYGTTQTGVYVTSVNNGSNAAEAGFRSGDIILEVNEQEVTSTSDVKAIINKLKVGDEVAFKVYRSGQTGTLRMELEEYALNPDITTQEYNSGQSIFDY